jgi:hypothetical protein
LKQEYTSIFGIKGTPAFSLDGYPLMLNMEPIRAALAYDKTAGTFGAEELGVAFWEQVVPMYVEAQRVPGVSPVASLAKWYTLSSLNPSFLFRIAGIGSIYQARS